mmetsp:Transcript_58703/g.102741  ORF Transcript_58703/g.102741 Transcript_58703/m.102741 type:complete len:309 (-) Transcript_58703:84-1010(-)
MALPLSLVEDLVETPVAMKSLLDVKGKDLVSSDGEETCDAISASGSASGGSSSPLEDACRNDFVCLEVTVAEAIAEGAAKAVDDGREEDLKDWETSWLCAVNDMQDRGNMLRSSRQMAGITEFVPGKATWEVSVEEAGEGEAEDEAETEMVPVLRWDDEVGKWVRDYIDVPVSQHDADSNADAGQEEELKRQGARHFQDLLARCFSKAEAQQKSMRAEAASFTPAPAFRDVAHDRRTTSIAVKEVTSLRVDAPSFQPMMSLPKMKPAAAYKPESSNSPGNGRFQQRTRLSSRAAAFVPVQWDSEDWSY